MRIVLFCNALLSDGNHGHGNAPCLRGIAAELLAHGHDARVYEPAEAWSLQNLMAEQGATPIRRFHVRYPGLLRRESQSPRVC